MKKRIFNILVFSLFIGVLHAQQNTDAIIGYYYMIDPFSKEGTQIYMSKSKDNNTYEAKVVWVSNPDKAKYIGLVFLTKLKYNIKKNAWEDAEVVYPGKKGTFRLDMKFDNSSKLKVRGYWGVSLLGMTMYWDKEECMRK